jgi:hypothetical protein
MSVKARFSTLRCHSTLMVRQYVVVTPLRLPVGVFHYVKTALPFSCTEITLPGNDARQAFEGKDGVGSLRGHE